MTNYISSVITCISPGAGRNCLWVNKEMAASLTSWVATTLYRTGILIMQCSFHPGKEYFGSEDKQAGKNQLTVENERGRR